MKITDLTEVKLSADGLPENCFVCEPITSPFRLYGVTYSPDDGYRRLPDEVAKNVSDSVRGLSRHTAGGRLRFVTDSPYIALSVKERDVSHFGHMPASGTCGFDVYDDTPNGIVYINTFKPDWNTDGNFTSVVYFETSGTHNITLNFPLYSGVEKLYLGFDRNSKIEEARPYKFEDKPIVFYGSSITQGGCASHPGGCYQAFISREFSCDYINLGFSGSCKAEDEMCRYIGALPMSIFVFDYDHNAPDSDFLERTHKPFFKGFRSMQPETPVVFMTRPKPHLTHEEQRRRDIIKATYDEAVAAGDKNVYFLDTSTIFEPNFGEAVLIDNCHPNDLGFMYMAKALFPVIKELLG